MTLKEKIEHIKKYQKNKNYHPLTCGNNSKHEVLYPVLGNDKVILKCLDCDYIQNWVPECIYNLDVDYELPWDE